jgi:flavin-dependent dehydrogenase
MAEKFDTDVFVAGGGPAGLAAAIAARQAGLTVALADSARPPIDKACGEGVMPAGVAALRQLGITLPSQPANGSGAPGFVPGQFAALRGMRFIECNGAIDAHFPHSTGCGVRRTVLHQLLVDRAAEVGVELHWGSRVTVHRDVRRQEVVVDGHTVRSRWLIGADGQNSRLRAQSGLDPVRGARRRFGFRCHYGVAPWSDFVEVHWSDRGQMYITPVATDQICVALLTAEPRLSFDEAMPHFPVVAERLRGAKRVSRMLGAVSVTQKLPLVWRGNLALIGEASGSVDAIAGEGLTVAFQQALALAEALAAGNLQPYQAAHRRIMGLPRFMTKLMLSMDRHANFRRRVLRAFSAEPSLFDRLLAIHIGAVSPFSFGARETVSLGWRLLTA